MFAKKLLSLVSLLFINQIAAVTISLPNGEACVSEDGTNGQIYAIFSSTTDGTYTYDSSYVTQNYGKIVKISGDTSCTVIEDIGYFKTQDDKYFSRNYNGEVTKLDDSPGTCSKSGVLGTDGKLCITNSDTGSIAYGDGSSDYLVTDANTVFTNTASNEVAITANSNSFILKKSITTDDYCISSSKKILERLNGFCTDSGCTSKYTCTTGTGICTPLDHSSITCRTDSVCNPVSNKQGCVSGGYYIVDSSDALLVSAKAADAGSQLYYCEDATTCKKVGTSAGETGSPIPTGYILNADTSNKNDIPYIKCEAGVCTAITETAIVANTCSSAADAGKLIKDGDYKLCVTSTSKVVLSTGESGSYFVGSVHTGEATTNAFNTVAPNNDAGAEKLYYFSVTVSGTDVTLDSPATDDSARINAKYKYTNASQKIFASRDAEICVTGSKIVEFTLNYCAADTATNYYSRSAEQDGPLTSWSA